MTSYSGPVRFDIGGQALGAGQFAITIAGTMSAYSVWLSGGTLSGYTGATATVSAQVWRDDGQYLSDRTSRSVSGIYFSAPLDGFTLPWGSLIGSGITSYNETYSYNADRSTIYATLTAQFSGYDSGYYLSGTVTGSATLNATTSAYSVAALQAQRSEGSGGTTAFTFTVQRHGNVLGTGSVGWTVEGSGANSADAADFPGSVLPSGTVFFAAGEASKTLTILVAADAQMEANEGFLVRVQQTVGEVIATTPTASAMILNDDVVTLSRTKDDAYTVLRGASLDIALMQGVLANDTGAASASVVTQPAHGSLILQSNGSFRYVPFSTFSGIDQFTYRATGTGAATDDADVTLHVIPVVVGATTTLNLVGLTPEEQIAATYVAFFGRGADRSGFTFWVDQFEKGLPIQGASTLFANIASSFAIGDEAKALYPFLANPSGASNAQIEAFLAQVYDNLFNRTPDAEGLAYWRGEIQNTLKAGKFVGSVLVNIMSGAQNSAAGLDITTLMSKVAVSLEYVQQQELYRTQWTLADDGAEAVALLDPVTDAPESLLAAMANAQAWVAADWMA